MANPLIDDPKQTSGKTVLKQPAEESLSFVDDLLGDLDAVDELTDKLAQENRRTHQQLEEEEARRVAEELAVGLAAVKDSGLLTFAADPPPANQPKKSI